MVKIKQRLGDFASWLLMVVCLIIMTPILLVGLVCYLLYTPIDYIRFKSSRYRKDFPGKYTWLCGKHLDNLVYTIVKKNDLPVSYYQNQDDKELRGYFIFRQTWLCFHNPFFFDAEKKEWLLWLGPAHEDAVEDGEVEEDDADSCVTVEEWIAEAVENAMRCVPGEQCKNVVFFCERKKQEKNYGIEAVDQMKAMDCFVVYEKGELEQAIINYVRRSPLETD